METEPPLEADPGTPSMEEGIQIAGPMSVLRGLVTKQPAKPIRNLVPDAARAAEGELPDAAKVGRFKLIPEADQTLTDTVSPSRWYKPDSDVRDVPLYDKPLSTKNVPVSAFVTAEFSVKVMSCVPISPTAPLIGVRLFTRISNVYNGLVADTAGTLACTIFTATVVPNAALSVCNTFDVAVSFSKETVRVPDSKPLTNLCAVSPIAVTSNSSAA